MNITEDLIAAETERLNLDERKTSISANHSSSSSVSSLNSTLDSNHPQCPCFKARTCCNCKVQGYHFAATPCLVGQWGPYCMTSPCWYTCHLPPNHAAPCCVCSKVNAKRLKPPRRKHSDKQIAKNCQCCSEGKCECCKTGKECGKSNNTEDTKSQKSDKESNEEENDQDNEEEEEDE